MLHFLEMFNMMKISTNLLLLKLATFYSLYYNYFYLQYFSYYAVYQIIESFLKYTSTLLTTVHLHCSASNLHITLKVYGWKSRIYIILQILAEQLLIIQVSCYHNRRYQQSKGILLIIIRKLNRKLKKLCLNLNILKTE